MNVRILKVAAKRTADGNFTNIDLQAMDISLAELKAILHRPNWGVGQDSPWLKLELQTQASFEFDLDGIAFTATVTRAKLSRPDVGEQEKVVFCLQKNICAADMALSSMVGACDEVGGEPIFYGCEITSEQMQAELGGDNE